MTKNWHRSILRKMPSCPQRKEFLHMHLPVVMDDVLNVYSVINCLCITFY